MKCKLLYVLLGMLLWVSCNDDSETLRASTEPESWYQLPQGDHPYDDKIVDWYERCGFYTLYKFEPKDVYFKGNDTWAELYTDTVWNTRTYTLTYPMVVIMDGIVYIMATEEQYALGEYVVDGLIQRVTQLDDNVVVISKQEVKYNGVFKVNPVKEDYVAQQLEWVEEVFLNFYSDPVLRQGMLVKLILGRELRVSSGVEFEARPGFQVSFNSLVFDYGDETLAELSLETKRKMKEDLHDWFLKSQVWGVVKSAAEVAGFFDVTNYSKWKSASSFPGAGEMYDLGVIIALPYRSLEVLQNSDLDNYIDMIIKNSYDKLIKEPVNGNYTSDYTGLLHSKKDRSGLILKKYNILVESLKKAGINIAGIRDLYQ